VGSAHPTITYPELVYQLSYMSLSAVILAGGQSQRMGRDKALLTINDTTLLYRICTVAQACTDRVYVLSPPRDYLLPSGCEWLLEDPPHQGPLCAFAQSLELVESEWILLLACDLPYIDILVLQRWIAELEQVPSNSIGYLAPHSKGWECLCGFYRSTCRQSLDQFIAAGGDSFQAWLKGQTIAPILNPEPSMFTNWNTPTDLPVDPLTVIFVYGTLLAGESNHGLLASAEFLGADSLANAQLYNLGEYPMMLPGAGIVTGEVYRVTLDTLAELDILEEHPKIYFRDQIILESGRSSQVYWGRSQYTINCPGIACGDWRLRDRISSRFHEE
jgi:molybdenum cofactor guanylyltransferase